MTPAEIAFLPATEQAALIRSRQLSPVEAVEAALAQIERLNPVINAVCSPAVEQARATAKEAEAAMARGEAFGPLHGLPVGIKDHTEVAGLRNTYGSKLFEHYVPAEDALLVQRLKAAGAVIVGKTNTPEFAAGINTRNALFGTTVNPWDTSLSSGGSSGGSAAALATGMCALAEGSDHGGSLRGPAAFCGVVGFRVSVGRIPAYPSAWVFDTFNVHGPMARTVRDVALMLSVMAGPDARNPLSIAEPGAPLAEVEGGPSASSGQAPSSGSGQALRDWRIAWTPDLGGLFRVDPDVAGLTEAAARRFADLGARVEDASPDLHDAPEIIPPLRAWRTAIVHQEQLDRLDQTQNDFLKEFAERARRLTIGDVARAEFQRSALWERTRRFFETYRLLALPTMQFAALPKDRDFPAAVGGQPVRDPLEAILSTYAISLTGLPAISVPCGFTESGIPVGLQLVGRWRAEADVLRAAAAFEDGFPWSHRRPPIAHVTE